MISSTIARKIIEHFDTCLEPLSRISKDPANNEIMIDSPEVFYNYDKIVREFYRELQEELPKSPDMLLFKKNTLVFVEFKNGKIDSREKDKIKLKALEGGILTLYNILSKYNTDLNFLDVVGLQKSYVLVYNPEKNPDREIHNRVYSQAPRFGLHRYEGTFFYRVKVLTHHVFWDWLTREENG
jgi:hypothetical protein